MIKLFWNTHNQIIQKSEKKNTNNYIWGLYHKDNLRRNNIITLEVIKNGWLITGDIAIFDIDGFLKIVDRKKEMVLVSGFNVYPNEVEHVISSHPKVLEVGVIGVSDEKTTEAVKAVIVKKDDSLTPQEIKDFCKEKLTNYKCPKHVGFTDELPKSNVGKILRRIIKEKDAENPF